MSEKKPIGSSSSFTSQLFGSTSSSPTSNHIFASLLQPSSLKRSEDGGKTEEIPWHRPKTESNSKSKELKTHNTSSRETNSFYEEQTAHPCHLSSSIYYGGQDNIYPHPHTTQNPESGFNSSIKKDGEEDDDDDDSGGASRGNWWKGSLYY